VVAQLKKKLAVLISGRGSNMESILKATIDSGYPAKIAIVISDNSDAKGLETARNAGIKAIGIDRKNYENRASHEAVVLETIDEAGVELICLAGYMRILSADFTRHYEGRLINIHPSLLPKFKGLDTHARAIEAGETEHGCTIHYVNEEMDGGEIIDQARVPILEDDTPGTLAARVLVEEHKLYPKTIARLAKNS